MMKLKKYLDIDWPENNEPLNVKGDIDEDSQLLFFTDWKIQRQFGCHLYEYFDSKIKLNILKGVDFGVAFTLNNTEYRYQASSYDDVWVVLFYPVSDNVVFGNLKGKSEFNKVVAGLFQATQLLIDKHEVKYIQFGTNDKDLMDVYDKIIPYIEKRLPLKFIKNDMKGKDKLYYFKVVGE